MRDDATLIDVAGLKRRFREVVEDEADIRAVVGQPPERSVAKVIDRIDEHARRFTARSPFVFVASVGADGTVDVSPRGDPPGFVRVLDERTLSRRAAPGARAGGERRQVAPAPPLPGQRPGRAVAGIRRQPAPPRVRWSRGCRRSA